MRIKLSPAAASVSLALTVTAYGIVSGHPQIPGHPGSVSRAVVNPVRSMALASDASSAEPECDDKSTAPDELAVQEVAFRHAFEVGVLTPRETIRYLRVLKSDPTCELL